MPPSSRKSKPRRKASAGATRQAVVLAAGEATRLRPLTARRPKGMLLVGGRPILQYQLEAMKSVGIKRVVLVVGDHAEKIQSFFKDGSDFGVEVQYAHQGDPTGTADAVRAALPHVDTKSPLLVLMGDNWLLADTIRPLVKSPPDALLVATSPVLRDYGLPVLKGGRLVRLDSAKAPGPPGRVSTGILHAGPELLGALAASEATGLHRFLNERLESGAEIATVDAAGPWADVTTPWDVLRLNERILHELDPDGVKPPKGATTIGAVRIGTHTSVAPTATLVGPVTIGDGCTIGEYTVVGPYVSIRNNTTVEAHCEVRRSILNNNVLVGSRSLLRGSILDDGVRVGAGFACYDETSPDGPVGCVLGADADLGPDCRVKAGALVDAETTSGPGERLGATV